MCVGAFEQELYTGCMYRWTYNLSNRFPFSYIIVMSRGIDLNTIALVVNYNIPRYARTYIHRCGRTARAGKSGQAWTLVPPNDPVRRFAKLRKEIAEPDRVRSATYPLIRAKIMKLVSAEQLS